MDECVLNQVTCLCGEAVSCGWWEGDDEHVSPVFVILDLAANGTVSSEVSYREKTSG